MDLIKTLRIVWKFPQRTNTIKCLCLKTYIKQVQEKARTNNKHTKKPIYTISQTLQLHSLMYLKFQLKGVTFNFPLLPFLYVPKHPGILLKCYLSINYKKLNKKKEEQIIFHSIDNLKYLTNSKKKKGKKIVCNTNVTDAWLKKQMSKRIY